jgi:OOP family OmpA-OmpF porin
MRFAAGLIAVLTTTSVASANVEVGGVAGLRTFSESGALGVVTDSMDNPTPAATSLKNSTFFGLRLGVTFGKAMGVEVEAGAIPTEPRSILFDLWMVAARAQFVYTLRTNDDQNKLLPFLMAGAGMLQIVDVGGASNEAIVKKDTKIAPYIGIGAKYRTQGGWGVRVDARSSLIQTIDREEGANLGKTGFSVEVDLLLSMYRDFGYKAPPKKKEVPPPPKDDDPDKDGIAGATDKCPTEPEDIDSFEDEDGCPDKDNDKDGVADAAPDKCLNDAEDKDGFEDEDGCPDPDNDNDGVLDAADKCGDKPETKNGFQDEDGCPDEIPETLKKFTGAIQGINFKVGDSALAPGTGAVLDKAVAVLKEFGDVKLEIQGHTDDQQLKAGGKFADNTALSQARADSVKAYFVSKGIAEDRVIAKGYGDTMPVEAPAGLTGAKLNAARTKNRRVEFKLVEGAQGAPAAPAPKKP